MNQEEFESKWYHKRIKCLGNHYKFAKDKEGFVTAALYRFYGDETIFSVDFFDIKATTFHIGNDEFDRCISDFEVL